MEMDSISLLFLLIIILIGVFLKLFWISLIFGIILVLALAFSRKSSAPAGARASAGGGAMVRPIIVKRKYVGPKSIYPGKMDIRIADITPSDWYEYGPQSVGKVMSKGAGWFKKMLFGEEK